MPNDFIKIDVKDLDKLEKAIAKFPRQSGKYLQAAGKEAAKRVIFPTEGLKKYPPATAANQPPEPYYIRGRGVMTKGGLKATSERLGTQWYADAVDKLNTEIGNRASYAKWVHGEEQARAMERIGWKKLTDVVKDKMGDVVKVYDAWIGKLLHDIGLK